MTKQQMIEAVDGLTDEELAALEKVVRTARAKLRAKDSHGWKTEGSDIDANPGKGDPIRRV